MKMRPLKFLALTDHRGHSSENSIYAILPSLATHQDCEYVEIASRGNKKNDPFFYALSSTKLFVSRITPDFNYRKEGDQFLRGVREQDLSEYDVILMRMPRPISSEFLFFISNCAQDKVLINDPVGIELTGSKKYLLNFPDICPPMKLCHSIPEIVEFSRQFPIVLKPLKDYGGKGILKIEDGLLHDGAQFHEVEAYLGDLGDAIQREGYLAMKFLRRVGEGDKRILVAGGEILAASLRLPAKGSWLCNVAQGGTAIGAEVAPEEYKIIETISADLMTKGILVFGADTLLNDNGMRVLSEINTLSIGGFKQAEIQTGRPILRTLINKMIEYVRSKVEQ